MTKAIDKSLRIEGIVLVKKVKGAEAGNASK